MTTTNFDALLEAHEDLSNFINKKELYYSSNFNDFQIPNDEFLEWVSPKFYESFVISIDEGAKTDLTWKLTRLMKTKMICNDEYRAKCEAKITEVFTGVVEYIRNIKDGVDSGNMSSVNDSFRFYKKAWIEAFNLLKGEDAVLREEFAQLSYDMAIPFKNDSLKENKASNVEIFDAVFLDLPSINCSPELKAKIQSASKEFISKVKKEVNKGTIITVVVVILIILKWIIRAAR